MSGSDDRSRAIGIPFYNGRGLPGCRVVLPVMDHIVDTGDNAGIDVLEKSRRRFTRNIGGSGNDRFAESFDQMPAEKIVYHPDGNRPIGIDKIIRQPDGAGIDHRRRLGHVVQVVEYPQIGRACIFKDIPFVGYQHDEAFRGFPLFEIIHASHSGGIGGITTDAPDRIGGIKDQPAGCKNGKRLFYVFVKIHLSRKNKLSLQLKFDKMELKQLITEAWANRELVKDAKYADAVRAVIEEVDKGRLRVASPSPSDNSRPSDLGARPTSASTWTVNEWVKQAILLYFGIQPMQTWDIAPFEFYDKMLLKKDYKSLGVRAVPHAVARYGAFLARNVVLMPSYVNIGAYVDEGTMVDTWATVGSCAQIGKGVHLSGGVGIGGVLEPLQASPVIIEDGVFLGSRSIVVEGVIVEKEAVLGANVVLTQSTKIIDVSGSSPVEYKGRVPARSVVIPGSYLKKFPAGEYNVSCALIIGQRKPSTDLKTSLNDALRDFNVAV